MESYLNFVDSHVSQDLSTKKTWKVLVVDDEEDIHKITRLVLKPLTFDNRSLDFIHAYSAKEAFSILETESDIAIVLLDVVMETDDAGLVLVERIREELKNKIIRIILRTGQPGQAPEKSVISKYDINDYKEKTELTTTKLFTSIISSLRSYKDLLTLESQKKIIEEKSFLNQYILNSMPCKSLLIDKNGTAISCNNTDNGNRDEDWLCVTDNGKCTEQCNWLKMNLPVSSKEKQRWEYKTEKKTYEVCYFPEENDIRLIYAFDISDRVKIEEEKTSFEKQLVQSQKMEAIGLLASGIVHDFNNYLTAISGFAQIIKNGKDVDYCIKYSEKIVKNVDKASSLISRLLVFSRKGKDEMHPIKISPLISDCIELLKTKSKLVKIKFEELLKDTYVYGDSNTLQNSLINLGINAIDAMPEGGELLYRLSSYNDNSIDDYYVCIEVRDNGTGISSNVIERIFEPFFTTKGEGKGTGLGLAGAYGCVKKHNGIIIVKSEEGKGTLFRILLPKLKHSNINSNVNHPVSLPGRENKFSVGLFSSNNVTADTIGTIIKNLDHDISIYSLNNKPFDSSLNFFKSQYDVLIADVDELQDSEQTLFSDIILRKNIHSLLLLTNNEAMSKKVNMNNKKVILRKPFEYDQFYNSLAKTLDLIVEKNI